MPKHPGKKVRRRKNLFDLRDMRQRRRDNRRRRALGMATLPEPDITFRVDASTEDLQRDGGFLIPEQLRVQPNLRGSKDALKTLFGPDLVGLTESATSFARAALEKGDQLTPEQVHEILRVAKTCSVIVSTPDSKNPEVDRKDPLQIKKRDDEKQIVWGEVYIPLLPDSQGDFMTAEEIERSAYGFLAAGRCHEIDQMHDGEACGAFVVESFIARKGDPMFIEGAWVVGVHIPDPEIWALVKDGTFNGFSMEGLAVRTEKQFELELPEQITGITQDENDHTHPFVVRFNDQGEFLGGESLPEGAAGADIHTHDIQKGTITEPGGVTPHVHRFSFTEAILELSIGR